MVSSYLKIVQTSREALITAGHFENKKCKKSY